MLATICAALTVVALAASPATEGVTLPGGPPVSMDYLAYDGRTGLLWVPAGNTGRIDVLDTRAGTLRSVDGIPTERRGERVVGASSAAAADGVVWVGNRADSSLCGFDATTLARRGCLTLPAAPDGLAFVPTTGEVWATLPRTSSLATVNVRNPAAPQLAATVKLEGRPEGYAVDAARGVYYTNLEDKDRTLAIDVRTHQVVAAWTTGCGEKGPRGIALDAPHRHLFVACTAGLRAFDLARNGALLASLETAGGVDNIDFLPDPARVYVASGQAGVLTVVAVDGTGRLSVASTTPTSEGCRTVVVDGAGTAYLPDSKGGRLVVVRVPR